MHCTLQLPATAPLAHGPLSNATQAEECNLPGGHSDSGTGIQSALPVVEDSSGAVNIQQVANSEDAELR